MKSTGMIRSVDKMGRVVIPKEIRTQLGVENEVHSFEIYMDGDCVVLRKYEPACIFCDEIREGVELGGHIVCTECLEKLKALADKSKEV